MASQTGHVILHRRLAAYRRYLADGLDSDLSRQYLANCLGHNAELAEMEKGEKVMRPCAADDFPAIRTRMEELRREREPLAAESELHSTRGPRPYAVGSRTTAPSEHGAHIIDGVDDGS